MPAATITTALLLPQDRIARTPLGVWAERLSARMEKCRSTSRRPRDLAAEVAGISNNGALIAVYRGMYSLAWSLCEAQIRWQGRLSRRSGDAEIAGNTVQPWVNLGRLEAMSGNCPAALRRFAVLKGYQPGKPLTLDCSRAGGHVEAPPTHTVDDPARVVYVIDPLKAMLQNGFYREALAFVEEVDPDLESMPTVVRRFTDEASIVAACRLGRFEHAQRTAVAASRLTRGWERAVFRLRLAEVLACDGDADAAAAILVQLAGVMGQVSLAARGELTSLYIMFRVCTACAEAGLTAEAVATARGVHEGARVAGDQVFEIESLRILAEMDAGPERERWRESLAELEETTDYARYRRGDGKPVRNPSIDRFHEMLAETLSC